MAQRFFSDDSFWNTIIAPGAAADPDSDRLIEVLRKTRPEGFWMNNTVYTIPVYEVDDTTPRRTVHRRFSLEKDSAYPSAVEASREWIGDDHPMGHGPGFGVDVPIPPDAMEDPEGDHHIAFIDRKNQQAWDMWAAVKQEDGTWASCSGMTYPLDGSGVFDKEYFEQIHSGESVHLYGPSRAPGVPAIAGLIMREEIVDGVIPHRLSFATSAVAHRQFVSPPARWTDGGYVRGVPEGCVLQLDPELELEQLGLTPAGTVIAKALQDYGSVCVDGCGGNVMYAEGLYGQPTSWDGLLDSHVIESLGYDNFRILKMEHIIEKGDDRHLGKHAESIGEEI